MTRGARIFDALSLLVLAGTAAVTGAVYDQLPQRMPVHFDLHGNPNGWMDRPIGAWLLVAVFWAAFRFSAKWMPVGEWRERVERSPMAVAAFLYTLFLAAIQPIVLWGALHHLESLPSLVMIVVGVYLLALSSLLPRVRRNPLVGIRTAWALTSDENWHRTNRFGSYALGASAVVAIVCGVVGGAGAVVTFVVASLGGALAPHVYSYVVARRLASEKS